MTHRLGQSGDFHVSESTDRQDEGFEPPSHLAFQKLEWRVQRIAWAFMALILAATFAGAFGGGPLAHARAGGTPNGLLLEYDRIARYRALSSLDFLIMSPPAYGEVRLWIARDFLDEVALLTVTPEPSAQEVSGDRIAYVFKTTGRAPLRIRFRVEPSTLWSHTGSAGVGDQPAITFSQFVLP